MSKYQTLVQFIKDGGYCIDISCGECYFYQKQKPCIGYIIPPPQLIEKDDYRFTNRRCLFLCDTSVAVLVADRLKIAKKMLRKEKLKRICKETTKVI